MAIIPPYLKKGDTIGIVCPAGSMTFEKAQTCISVLQQWGYEVHVGKTLGTQYHYFSGTDEERLNDLQHMLDDDNVKAILCGRGGYGTGRIIDRLNFKAFRKSPKWLIGFSDVTVIHAHIYTKFNTASMHAPMAGAFNNDEGKNEYVQSLRKALTGKVGKYVCAPHPLNNPGTAGGELVGGNLSLLAHLSGTASAIKTTDRILFLEDVGEYIYNIDRMLYQLKRNGKFKYVAGLIIGGFTDMKDTIVPFGKPVYEVIKDVLGTVDFPVCFGFPVSHGRENVALKIGVKYRLKVRTNEVILSEL